MTALQAAAQQALTALSCIEYGICGITYGPSDDTTEAAIDALQAALVEPQRKPLTLEQIQELSQQHKFDSRMEKLVRIVERAHGIT